MSEQERRSAAIKRVSAKRYFRRHVANYLVVNALLVGVWALTGSGSFWPGWVMLVWGAGLASHGWNTFYEKPISEDEIRRELEKGD